MAHRPSGGPECASPSSPSWWAPPSGARCDDRGTHNPTPRAQHGPDELRRWLRPERRGRCGARAGRRRPRADLEDGLGDAGFRPDVRVAPRADAATAQRRPSTGSSATARRRCRSAPSTRGRSQVRCRRRTTPAWSSSRSARAVPASGTGGDGVSADHRVPTSDDPAATRARGPDDVVRSLQRGEQPDRGRLTTACPCPCPCRCAVPLGRTAAVRRSVGHHAGNDSVIVSTRALRERRGPASQAPIAPTKPCATKPAATSSSIAGRAAASSSRMCCALDTVKCSTSSRCSEASSVSGSPRA